MKPAHRKFILKQLKQHNIMSLATVRADGFPQATTVGYANDGLDIYFCCDRASQKVRNLRRSAKVSLTIDHDARQWASIKGLSMGARARVLSKPREVTRAFELLAGKFPQMRKLSAEDLVGTAFVKAHAESDLGPGLLEGLRPHRPRPAVTEGLRPVTRHPSLVTHLKTSRKLGLRQAITARRNKA